MLRSFSRGVFSASSAVSCGARSLTSGPGHSPVPSLAERSARIYEVSRSSTKALLSAFPSVVEGVSCSRSVADLPHVGAWLTKVLEGTVPLGSNTTALNTFVSYQLLATPDQLTEQHLQQANVMSWCAEMHLSFQIVLDDIVDGAQTRRGTPCWHRRPGGEGAALDCFLIQGAALNLLRDHFRNQPFFHQALDTFLQVTYKTCLGQTMDTLVGRDLTTFTPERYAQLVRHKNNFILAHLPVTLAMHMSGVNDPKTLEDVQKVLDFASFIQIENDFLDCYGDYKALGKAGGVDVNNGSMSWLLVTALQRASHLQKAQIQRWYGRPGAEAARHVKEVYDDLGLPGEFERFKEESYRRAREDIGRLENWRLQDALLSLLDRIYQRGSYWVI